MAPDGHRQKHQAVGLGARSSSYASPNRVPSAQPPQAGHDALHGPAVTTHLPVVLWRAFIAEGAHVPDHHRPALAGQQAWTASRPCNDTVLVLGRDLSGLHPLRSPINSTMVHARTHTPPGSIAPASASMPTACRVRRPRRRGPPELRPRKSLDAPVPLKLRADTEFKRASGAAASARFLDTRSRPGMTAACAAPGDSKRARVATGHGLHRLAAAFGKPGWTVRVNLP